MIVTGTRSLGTKASESVAPISILSGEELAQTGQRNLIDALARLEPSFVGRALGGDYANIVRSAEVPRAMTRAFEAAPEIDLLLSVGTAAEALSFELLDHADAAEAALKQAEANALRDAAARDQARSQEKRYQELLQKNFVSKEAYAQIATNAQTAEATAKASQAARIRRSADDLPRITDSTLRAMAPMTACARGCRRSMRANAKPSRRQTRKPARTGSFLAQLTGNCRLAFVLIDRQRSGRQTKLWKTRCCIPTCSSRLKPCVGTWKMISPGMIFSLSYFRMSKLIRSK